MTAAQVLRQHDSARHYLHKPPQDTALQAALTIIGRLFAFPMVQVNILDNAEHHTIAAVGTPLGSRPRSDSVCDLVVRDGVPKRLTDLQPVPVGAAHLQAYIGVPITGREGLVIGALCLMDTVTRHLGDDELGELVLASTVVQDQLELLRRLEPTAAGSTAAAASLGEAVDCGQIVSHYQPIVDIASGRTIAVEALARWQHPDLGLLPPSAFLPLAEDSDIIIDLDLSVLHQACTDLASWTRLHPSLRLTVNLSARHFQHPECIDRLTRTVVDAGAAPQSVSFEVTETAAFAGHVQDRSFLHDLRAAGFQVLLDDFGTGFSSLDQLLRLPIDGIKLDRSITAGLGTPSGDAITRALITMAAEMDLQTVTEGIETPRQAAQARSLGCRLGQGYLWAAAMPAGELTDYLR